MPVPAVILVPAPIALAAAALETPALLCLFVAGGLVAGRPWAREWWHPQR